MKINRRRAPSSKISSEKKISGHQREADYSDLIEGEVIKGTQKGDVKDKNNVLHSVKSGKKWQIFLYSYNRISDSKYLKILKPCLDSFPTDYNSYRMDREKCIAYKENYIKENGREAAKKLSNKEVENQLGSNVYIDSKTKLGMTTDHICETLKSKDFLYNFLGESIFNNQDVKYLAIKDTHYNDDGVFKVFDRHDVLKTFTGNLNPSISKAGHVPEDFNVAGQKTLLTYKKNNGRQKNIVEIEIRNDSELHYRQVRFNMYSKDALFLLSNRLKILKKKSVADNVIAFNQAINTFNYLAS